MEALSKDFNAHTKSDGFSTKETSTVANIVESKTYRALYGDVLDIFFGAPKKRQTDAEKKMDVLDPNWRKNRFIKLANQEDVGELASEKFS
jgi:hypothetical protein